MPPKKKQRASSIVEGSTPTASTPADTTSTGQGADIKMQDLEPELWTDDEEISLFKGMIRWKPVGMHKRFRMISLSQHMRHHGHNADHTRPAGIWQKLDGLYNMKVLDERENAIDDGDADTSNERYCEFTLPTIDFHELMMAKRLDEDRGSSPGWLDETGDEDIGSTIEDSDEPLSSPASSIRGSRGGRRGRGTRGSRGGRGRGAKDSTPRARTRAESEASEASGEDEGDEDDDDEEEDENEDEDGEDEEEDAGAGTPSSRGVRGRGRGRGARGRGRGRAGRKRG